MACRTLPFDTPIYHCQSRRTDPAFLKKRVKEICETRVRYGYRRVKAARQQPHFIGGAFKLRL
jgi:putative transposase